MKRDEFTSVIENELEGIKLLFGFKNQAYGRNDDLFYNFRNTSIRIFNEDTFENMLKAILVYKDKHDVAVANRGLTDPEFNERMRDIIVYCLLAIALHEDFSMSIEE